MNNAQPRQTPANANILPWNPSTSINDGKYFAFTNDKTQNSVIQNDMQVFLIFSRIISDATVNVNGWTPKVETKKTDERLPSGIQFKASTCKPHDLSSIYTPSTVKQLNRLSNRNGDS